MVLWTLSACQAQDSTVFEYVTDELTPMTQPQQISFALPSDAKQVAATEDLDAVLYAQTGGEYEIQTQILQQTDLEQLVDTLTGYPAQRIQCLQTGGESAPCYHFAWSSSGESGQVVSRASVIQSDDYSYALIFTTPAGLGTKYQSCMNDVFASFHLQQAEEN